MIEWEPNKNDANLNIPVDGQVASICWNEQTKLLTMSLAYSAVYGMGERYNGLNQNAVSYTHLDVYKRQAVDWGNQSSSRVHAR